MQDWTATDHLGEFAAVFYEQHLSHLQNVGCVRGAQYVDVLGSCLSAESIDRARSELTTWQGYAPTPLISLCGLARELEIDKLWLKDESGRFDLGSFKGLGGGYAVFRVLANSLEEIANYSVTTATELRSAKYAARLGCCTVVCASDGNHGRAVAWAARMFGSRCVVYLHAGVSQGREDALRSLGADVVRIKGNYDDSVREAVGAATRPDWYLVQDAGADMTDYSARYTMAGYTVLIAELVAQLGTSQPPTHVFVQAGVGGLAAAVAAGFHRYWADIRPRLVLVEPEAANCVFMSVKAQTPVVVRGLLDTLMAGLACGEVSLSAWPILQAAVDDVVTLPDALVQPTMRLLFNGVYGDQRIVSGESGVAGLAAVIAASQQGHVARALGLTSQSRILVCSTEGATDPGLFGALVPEAAKHV